MSGSKTYKTRWVTARLDRLKKLPDPDEEFTKDEVHPRLKPLWQQLRSHDVLNSETTIHGADTPDGGRTVWSTRESAYEKIHELLDNRPDDEFPALPCGDHGAERKNGRFHCKMDHHDDGEHRKSWTQAELEHYYEHGELPRSETDDSTDLTDADAGTVTDGGQTND
jgi:hypothetical protein